MLLEAGACARLWTLTRQSVACMKVYRREGVGFRDLGFRVRVFRGYGYHALVDVGGFVPPVVCFVCQTL